MSPTNSRSIRQSRKGRRHGHPSPDQRHRSGQWLTGWHRHRLALLLDLPAHGQRQKKKSANPRGWHWPARGRISGVFGSQRILNGVPRQPHYGLDIARPTGTPVYAPASGVVTLVEDLYYSGWTVILGHGLGVNSAFLHLDMAAVKTGDTITRGQLIGHIGATGRATGPHLDWRIDWNGRRIDPGLLVDMTNKP